MGGVCEELKDGEVPTRLMEAGATQPAVYPYDASEVRRFSEVVWYTATCASVRPLSSGRVAERMHKRGERGRCRMDIEKMYEREDVEQLVRAFSMLHGEADIKAFLADLLTPREVCDLAQRLQVARCLDEGEPYVQVQARTGASSTTVSRVSKALNGEYGGYRRLLIRLEDER